MTETLEVDGNEGQLPVDRPEHEHQSAQDAASEIDLLRSLVAKAHPDTVPEMLQGETLTAILASVEPAREAYRRIADQVRQGQPAGPNATAVDADIRNPPHVDATSTMPAAERLRLGLRQRAATTART